MTERELTLYWRKVEKGPGCWLWTAATNKNGYGVYTVKSQDRVYLAHRLAFILEHGPLLPGECVCHKCDRPRCVRYDHLFKATQSENRADCVRKGRHARGTKQGNASMVEQDVVDILRMVNTEGMKPVEVANAKGISNASVYKILRGGSWREVVEQHAQAETEYKTLKVWGFDLDYFLKRLAQQGWTLVTQTPTEAGWFRLDFERPKYVVK